MCRICDNDPDLHTPSLARRRFLEVAGLGTAAALTLGLTPPNEQPSDATERTLDLYRIHSRKRLRVTYLEVAGLGTAAALTLGLTPPTNSRAMPQSAPSTSTAFTAASACVSPI